MRVGLWMGAAVAALFPASLAAAGGSLWHYSYQNGISEYLTGEWDSPTGGALNLSCKDKGVSIMPQIKGQAPPPRSSLRLITSSRAGSQEHRFSTNAQGSVELSNAAGSPAFRRLWADLRARDIVTIRYADGRTSVQSLAGARKTLPVTPCAE